MAGRWAFGYASAVALVAVAQADTEFKACANHSTLQHNTNAGLDGVFLACSP